tara:strand:- start:204 stop:440 length:237 start_codon:yes stop_codon:yes gene_type:complete
MTTSKRIYRNLNDKKIAGICSGLADYFNIDPVLVRLISVFLLLLGPGLIIYLVGWIIIPVKNSNQLNEQTQTEKFSVD